MLPFLPLFRRLRHGLTLGVRLLAIDGEGRLLLVKHGYTPGWHLPGGGVDVGESAEAAARRELKEEANAEVEGALRLHGLFFHPSYGSAGPRAAAEPGDRGRHLLPARRAAAGDHARHRPAHRGVAIRRIAGRALVAPAVPNRQRRRRRLAKAGPAA